MLLQSHRWPQHMQVADLVGSRPIAERAALWERLNEKAAGSMTEVSDVQAAVATLPKDQQFAAVTTVIKQLSRVQSEEPDPSDKNANSARSDYYRTAAEHVLQSLSNLAGPEFVQAVALADSMLPPGMSPRVIHSIGANIRPEDVPHYISELAAGGRNKLGILEAIGERSLSQATTDAEKVAIMSRLLQQAAPSQVALDSLASLWKKLPAGSADALAAQVSPDLLAHYLLGAADQKDIDAIVRQPHLLEAIAAGTKRIPERFEGRDGAVASQAVVKLYSQWANSGSLTESIAPLLADSSPVDTFTNTIGTALSIIADRSEPADKQRALDLVDKTAASADAQGVLKAFGVASGISESDPIPADIDPDKTYWQSDNKFLYEYLARGSHSSDKGIYDLIRVGNAWRSSGSIFPAIHEAMSTPGSNKDRNSRRSEAEQMAYSIFMHARRNSEKIMDDYARNVFSGQWSSAELKVALSHLSDYVKRDDSPAPSDARNSDHALIKQLVDHDFQRLKAGDVGNAIAFAGTWRTTGSLSDGWQAMSRKARWSDQSDDRYLISVAGRVARYADPEQQRNFVRFATKRVLDPATSMRESLVLSSVLRYKIDRQETSLLEKHQVEAPVASGVISALVQNSERMPADEVTQNLQIARDFLANQSTEKLLASIDQATAKPRENNASIDCIAQMVGTLPAASQEAFAAQAAAPLLQPGASDELVRSRIDLLSAMSRKKVAPELLGAEPSTELAVNVTRALTTEWRVNARAAKLALEFGHDRLAGKSLVESWDQTASAAKGNNQLANDTVVSMVARVASIASALEKQDLRAHLETRLFDSADSGERALALGVLNALTRDHAEIFVHQSQASQPQSGSVPGGGLNAAQVTHLAALTEHADGDKLVRILDDAKATVLAPSLETSFDAAISKVDQSYKFGYLAKMMAARAADANPDQRRALLKHIDASIDSGTVDQATTASEIGVALLKDHPDLFDGRPDAPELMRNSSAVEAMKSALIGANDPDYGRRIISGLRNWQNSHDVQSLVDTALSGTERELHTALRLVTMVLADRPSAEKEEAASAIIAKMNSDYSTSDFESIQHTVTELNDGKCPESYIKQLALQAQNTQNEFAWRLSTINYLSKLKLSGEDWPADIELPSVRMPALEGVDPQQVEALRQNVETTFAGLLADPASAAEQLRKMIGSSGELGKLLPSVFGDYEKSGGIVGRPQSGESSAALDQRTVEAVERVAANRATEALSEKDKVNLVWATLLHAVGSVAGEEERTEQDQTSGEVAWGVLQTLGYPAQRISRIVDLISKRSEVMRLKVDEKTEDGKTVQPDWWARESNDQIIAGVRHPAFSVQWRILNEAVLRSTNPSSFTPEVSQNLDDLAATMKRQAAKLSQYSLPLLSSTVPREFGFHYKPDNYAFMMHRTASIADFFELLGSAESKEFSMSATLVTPKVQRFVFRDTAPFKLIVGAPWENIAQAYRGDLYTGMGVGWQEHVQAMRYWLGEHTISTPRRFESISTKMDRENQKRSLVGKTFAAEVDQRLRAVGFAGEQKPYSALKQARLALSQFDTLDELQAATQPGDPLRSAHDVMVTALTYWKDGRAQTRHNEIKVANPSILGVAAFRKAGQTVSFAGVDDAHVDRLFANSQRPDWVSTGVPAAAGDLEIPASVVQTLEKNKLPLVILDWTRDDLNGPMHDDF
jgi:hypothetical protein